MDPSFHDLGGFSNRGRYYKKPTILLWGYHGIGMIRYDIYILPICSMYGIFTSIYPKNHPNVRKYTIYGAYGLYTYII